MSAAIEVPAGERGVVRLFTVDLDDDAARRFNRRNGGWPLSAALGATGLDPAHVECFDLADLEGVGLVTYLKEGLGVSEAELSPLRPRLDALSGWVVVITSRAFGGMAQRLTPRAPLRLVATLHEKRPPVVFERIPSQAAQGRLGAAPDDAGAAPAGRAGLHVLVALLLLLLLVLGAALAFLLMRAGRA